MPSYRLLNRILAESKKTNHSLINEDEFVFITDLFRSPDRTRAELQELRRLDFIEYPESGYFRPRYAAYHWKQSLAAGIFRFIFFSVITPIAVTLATMWLTGQL